MEPGLSSDLTPKQELFAQNFALCANATRAAKLAGVPIRSARTMGSRWLMKVDVRLRITELRDEQFGDLKHQIVNELYSTVALCLDTGLYFPQARRAQALLTRLGIWSYSAQLRDLRLTTLTHNELLEEIARQLAAEFQRDYDREEQLRKKRRHDKKAKRERAQKILRLAEEIRQGPKVVVEPSAAPVSLACL